jgi:two-component system response regulator
VTKTVLLIEDNPDHVELTGRAFREIGSPHRLVVARDGAEALDYLFATGPHAGRNPDDKPALVLLDLKLPKLGGLDVLKRFRSYLTLNRMPVAVLTSSTEERDRRQADSLGANLFLQKPVEFEKFIEVLRQVEKLVDAQPEPG